MHLLKIGRATPRKGQKVVPASPEETLTSQAQHPPTAPEILFRVLQTFPEDLADHVAYKLKPYNLNNYQNCGAMFRIHHIV